MGEQAELDVLSAIDREFDPPDYDANPRAIVGGNKPPNAYDACVAHMEDLLTEARNWADGAKVETQDQADAVDRLIEDLRLAEKASDDARVAEKKPLDDLIQEIQDRWNVYLAPLKNKKPGKLPVAMDALKATVTPWKNKLEAERQAAAAEARRIALEAAQKAQDALRATQASDIAAREEAEALVDAAARAAADANRADKGAKVSGLRSYWTATITDRKAALIHYLTTDPDAVVAFLQQLADQDVRAGKRQIPGFTVTEERRA